MSAKPNRQQWLALTAVIISSSVVFLDGSVVNLALPALARDLHAGFTAQQWVVDGYLLSLSALILLGGTLGDIFGRKRVYLIGLIGFGLTSLLCAVVPSAGALVAARLLQGVFGALLVPGALAIITTNFASDQRGLAFGRWTAWSSAATAVGPPFGGWLIDVASWRLVFLINLPLIAASLLLALPSIQESRDPNPRRLDLTGALLAMLSLGSLTYALIEGPPRHWPAGLLVLLAAAVVFGVLFVIYEARAKDPMLPLRLFRSPNFSATNIVTFAMYGALGGLFFALVIYLQSVVGYTSMQAGMASLPVTFMLLLLSSRVGALSAKRGPRLFMTLGPIIAGLGMLLLWPLGPGAHYLTHVLPGIILFGLGLAITVAPLTTTVMASVPEISSGIASAVNNAVARVAGLLVVAMLGLFGASIAQTYHPAIALCAGLALAAGLIAWFTIKNPSRR
jgi:EmrB/QacA subfamily drug resistance transporter